MEARCVADLEGPWIDPGWESGLIERCERHWNTPIGEIPDDGLATYLRQRIALPLVIPEAHERVSSQRFDGSEMFDGELAEALESAKRPA